MNSTTQSDLAFIRQIVDDSRHRLATDALPFIVFGVTVAAGVVGELGLRRAERSSSTIWLWLGVVAVAWLASAVLWRRRRRRVGARSLADRVVGGLWAGCWASMCVVGFGGSFSGQLSGSQITGTLAAMLGAGFFATGYVVDAPPIRWLAGGWWLTALTVYATPDETGMAVFGVAMLILQVFPAWLWRRKWLGTTDHG